MNASDVNKWKAYDAYLGELDKLRIVAAKKDFSQTGEAEFEAQRKAASDALDAFMDACREESRHEDC